MKTQSIDLLEFQKLFPDDAACLDHLFRLRWSNGFICPRCGNRTFSLIKTRRLHQCKSCRYQASLTAGTIFHKTRTPIHKWFWMIFMMTRQKSGVAMLRMQALLRIGSYKTAWLMGHKIRKGMEDRDSLHKLAGLTDLHETFAGRRNKDSDERANPANSKSHVRARSEGDKAGDCGACPPERAKVYSEHLSSISEMSSTSSNRLESSVASNGYGESKRSHPGFIESGPKKRLKKSSWLYAAIANVKGNIRGVHHGVSRKHLHRYLAEFFYRFNRRRWDAQLFNRALIACLKGQTLTLAELTV